MSSSSRARSTPRSVAAMLRDGREELLRRWTRRVIEDPRIPATCRMTEPELRDEVPELLGRIVDELLALERGEAERPESSTADVARRHAQQRFSRGCGLVQELHELCHLRAAILELWSEERLRGDVTAARLVHAVIDETMVSGADEMERMTRERERWLTELLDESHEAVLVWELGGGIASWNRGAEELYGFTAAEAIGRSPHELLRTWSPSGSIEEVERILVREGRWEGELRHTAQGGGELWVESRFMVRSREGKTMVLEMNRDVTERRRAEEAQRESEERLRMILGSERAARTEAERAARLRDEFVATVSHELRTPLNAILGWAGMLRRSKLDAAATAKAIEVVERNAKAQAELVEDLLDISRIGSGKLRLDVRRVDLSGILENVVASHLPAAEAKGVRLDRMLDQAGCTIQGDPGRLEQIASNLLSNAVKFTPQGGRVSVVCRREDGWVEIVVSDTGKGIRPDFLPYAFDRFRQADASLTRQHRGLGLGLTLVKFLVEQHGGEIRAESEGEGRGATFTVSLPAATGDGEVYVSPIDACSSLQGVSALVVDDEEDARSLLRHILEECEAHVTVTASASEALAELPRLRPDVLISDIGMPELDGYQLIRAVRDLAPEQGGATPAVALTAFARPEDRLRALRAGYQMHVAKPIDQSELLLVVASLTGRLKTKPAEPTDSAG